MKVKELIEKLKALDPDAVVYTLAGGFAAAARDIFPEGIDLRLVRKTVEPRPCWLDTRRLMLLTVGREKWGELTETPDPPGRPHGVLL